MDLLGGLFDGLRAAADHTSPIAKSPAPPVVARTPASRLRRERGEGQGLREKARPGDSLTGAQLTARRSPAGGDTSAESQPHRPSPPHRGERNAAAESGELVWGDADVASPEEEAGNVVVEALVTMGFDRGVAELAVGALPPIFV